ncbi:MAG: deoxyribonuclease IV [Longimicrobiales bacterium]|nr:deoxyribonuclease IV [Longimicrobiales bacterium]
MTGGTEESGRTDGEKSFDELGAHVSSAGGVQNAPGRAREIESVSLQLFTKQPSRWAEPVIDAETAEAFHAEREGEGIRVTVAHDSYLINLSSPDPELWERSYACFEGELRRSAALGLDFVVTHPGNATDGDMESGLARNAQGVGRALEAVPDGPVVLLELTAGSGTSVGATFENLAAILEGVPEKLRSRVGVCVDTCHAYSAGYDLVEDYDGVWARFDDVLGLDRLGLFHLNDSRNPFDSRKDRHEHIGQGSLGEAPFRRIMTDDRFFDVPKLLETPKEDDPVANDLRNLGLLRSFRTDG